MWVGMKRGKNPTPMRLEEQVEQSVESRAKIVVVTEANDKSTTVENYVQFELPPVEVGFLTKQTYKTGVGIAHTKTVLHMTTCLVDTRAGLN